jgi:hypothetical protein
VKYFGTSLTIYANVAYISENISVNNAKNGNTINNLILTSKAINQYEAIVIIVAMITNTILIIIRTAIILHLGTGNT